MTLSYAGTMQLAGRILIAALFVESGVHKLIGFQGAARYMVNHGMPFAEALLAGSIVLELAGAVMLIIGWHARWAALALALFVVALSLIFHAFWAYSDPGARVDQLNHFMKNIAIIGGLLCVAGASARSSPHR